MEYNIETASLIATIKVRELARSIQYSLLDNWGKSDALLITARVLCSVVIAEEDIINKSYEASVLKLDIQDALKAREQNPEKLLARIAELEQQVKTLTEDK